MVLDLKFNDFQLKCFEQNFHHFDHFLWFQLIKHFSCLFHYLNFHYFDHQFLILLLDSNFNFTCFDFHLTFFNFVQDINGIYFLFLSEQDEADIAQTEYASLLSIPLSPYTPPPTPPIP